MNQLVARAVRIPHRQSAQSPRIARAAGKHLIVEDDTAARKISNEKIGIIRDLAATAKAVLGCAGRSGVIGKIHAIVGEFRDLGGKIEAAPRVHFHRRGIDRIQPVPHLERGRDADPADPLNLARRKITTDHVEPLAQELQNRIRCRKLIRAGMPCPQLACEIHQHEIAAPAPDLQSQRQHPIRFSATGVSGLPTLPRWGSPFTTSSSASSLRKITETVCGDSRVLRAISAEAIAPCRWIRDSISRSL